MLHVHVDLVHAGLARSHQARRAIRHRASCILAAVGMARLMKAAKKAMNEASGVPALLPGASQEQRLQHWKSASAKGSVKAYLDNGDGLLDADD